MNSADRGPMGEGAPQPDIQRVPGPAGALMLVDLVRSDGTVGKGLPPLPVRLRGSFLERPWPAHSLGERIVDAAYIPPAPSPPDAEPWTLAILADRRLWLGGRICNLFPEGYPLRFLNICLLTRDLFLE